MNYKKLIITIFLYSGISLAASTGARAQVSSDCLDLNQFSKEASQSREARSWVHSFQLLSPNELTSVKFLIYSNEKWPLKERASFPGLTGNAFFEQGSEYIEKNGTYYRITECTANRLVSVLDSDEVAHDPSRAATLVFERVAPHKLKVTYSGAIVYDRWYPGAIDKVGNGYPPGQETHNVKLTGYAAYGSGLTAQPTSAPLSYMSFVSDLRKRDTLENEETYFRYHFIKNPRSCELFSGQPKFPIPTIAVPKCAELNLDMLRKIAIELPCCGGTIRAESSYRDGMHYFNLIYENIKHCAYFNARALRYSTEGGRYEAEQVERSELSFGHHVPLRRDANGGYSGSFTIPAYEIPSAADVFSVEFYSTDHSLAMRMDWH